MRSRILESEKDPPNVQGGSAPRAPSYDELPEKSARTRRAGPMMRQIEVCVETVTPILGGSSQTRTIDEVDIVRATTIRGHLRFWWRALHATRFESAKDLYAEEGEIWGRAATEGGGGRSDIDVRINVERRSEIDTENIRLYDSREGSKTQGAYALWPAREERGSGTPPAPRYKAGMQFRIVIATPQRHEEELRKVIRAWILFGGYGSRTRRGLGSVKVLVDAKSWLPPKLERDAITALFHCDIFAAPERAVDDAPCLRGAAFQVSKSEQDPMNAWCTALEWLSVFRQGTDGPRGQRAREPGNGKQQPKRPSISNWPEADKIRHLTRKMRAHPPVHNENPVWPRAGFGLPIIGQFQLQARDGTRYNEPEPFELGWRSGAEDHDRLSSPLIVKALPLADGRFVSCALWLNRTYPKDGSVGLYRQNHRGRQHEKEIDPTTTAPFDCLVAPGDTPRFSALANKKSLRQAFLDWLHTKYKTTVVAP